MSAAHAANVSCGPTWGRTVTTLSGGGGGGILRREIDVGLGRAARMLDLVALAVTLGIVGLEQEDQERVTVLADLTHELAALIDRLQRTIHRTPASFRFHRFDRNLDGFLPRLGERSIRRASRIGHAPHNLRLLARVNDVTTGREFGDELRLPVFFRCLFWCLCHRHSLQPRISVPLPFLRLRTLRPRLLAPSARASLSPN